MKIENLTEDQKYDLLIDDMANKIAEAKESGKRPPILLIVEQKKKMLDFSMIGGSHRFFVQVAILIVDKLNRNGMR